MISNFSTLLDVSKNLMQMGDPDVNSYKNKSLHGFLSFRNQKDTVDDGSWAVRIEDVMYGSPINGTSLDDEFSDLAIVDTMFPGLLIPNRAWGNFKSNLIKNISASGNASVVCGLTENILGSDYSFCYA